MTRHHLDAPGVLTHGAWVPDKRGVLRWVPGPAPAGPTPLAITVALLIACPYCRAKGGETCKSSGGHPVIPHAARLIARYCRCGERLVQKRGARRLCDACRDEERRASKRLTRANRARCGTDSGYRRHRRLGEDACRPCLRAHSYAVRQAS